MQETIENYLSYIAAEKGLSRNYQLSILSTLEKFSKWMIEKELSLQEIRASHIIQFMEEKRKTLSESSIRMHLLHLKSFFKWISKIKSWENPAKNILNPKITNYLIRCLEPEEIQKFIERIDVHKPLGKRDVCLVELLYGCGVRASEITKISLNEVNFEERVVRIMGKGNKPRILPIGRKAEEALLLYAKEERPFLLARNKSPLNLFFLTKRGEKMGREAIYQMIRRRAKQQGLDFKIYPHIFRHSFAVHMLENDSNLRVIQELLGHSDISTTEIYLRGRKEDLKKVHRKFHPRS